MTTGTLFQKFLLSHFRKLSIDFFMSHETINLIIRWTIEQFSWVIAGIRTIISHWSDEFFMLLDSPHSQRPHLLRCHNSMCRELALLWLQHHLFLLKQRWFYGSVKTLLPSDSPNLSNTSLYSIAWKGVIIRSRSENENSTALSLNITNVIPFNGDSFPAHQKEINR